MVIFANVNYGDFKEADGVVVATSHCGYRWKLGKRLALPPPPPSRRRTKRGGYYSSSSASSSTKGHEYSVAFAFETVDGQKVQGTTDYCLVPPRASCTTPRIPQLWLKRAVLILYTIRESPC
jgi:hypothetical protein